MNTGLYKSLTLEDKIALLHFERGASALVSISHYEDLSVNPNTNPRTNALYISNVLDLDWEEFSNNDSNIKKGKECFEVVKAAAISITREKDIRSGHIVDALNDILYLYTHPDEGFKIDKALVNIIDNRIKRVFKVFKEFNVEYEPIEGVIVGGKQAYRRVEK